MILDIGVGNRPRGDVNLDVWPNPNCNIIGDAHYLPIKNNSCKKTLCSQVIEHLYNPLLALSEIERTLRNDGIAKIDVPKPSYTNNSKYRFLWFILNFPLSIFPKYIFIIADNLFKIKRRDASIFHKYIITKELIAKFFKIEKSEEIGDILYFFLGCGKKSRYFKNKPKINTAYLFTCRKRMIK